MKTVLHDIPVASYLIRIP